MSTEQQDTTYLSEEQLAEIHSKASMADPLLRPVNRAVVLKVIELAESHFATHYEQKGAEGERKRLEAEVEKFIDRQELNSRDCGDVVPVTSLEYFAEDGFAGTLSEKETDQPSGEESRS